MIALFSHSRNSVWAKASFPELRCPDRAAWVAKSRNLLPSWLNCRLNTHSQVRVAGGGWMATGWEWWHHCLSLAKTEPLNIQTTLLSSRTRRCFGLSAGIGSWSPLKCGEIFRSNWNHSRLLALILDKQDKQTWLKWELVINTLFSCFSISSKSNSPSLKVSRGSVWRVSGACYYLVNNKFFMLCRPFMYVWCSQHS